MIRARILFSGRVQGVGFRFTTQSIATSLGLRGWVKNLRDGRVEVLAEGERDAIENLKRALEDHFGSYIQQANIRFEKCDGEFNDFQIV